MRVAGPVWIHGEWNQSGPRACAIPTPGTGHGDGRTDPGRASRQEGNRNARASGAGSSSALCRLEAPALDGLDRACIETHRKAFHDLDVDDPPFLIDRDPEEDRPQNLGLAGDFRVRRGASTRL